MQQFHRQRYYVARSAKQRMALIAADCDQIGVIVTRGAVSRLPG
ncbi:hypothetical protein [Aurantiacibacter marinus]|nr:hypothetical protein [Aurantiacibacter marinus]